MLMWGSGVKMGCMCCLCHKARCALEWRDGLWGLVLRDTPQCHMGRKLVDSGNLHQGHFGIWFIQALEHCSKALSYTSWISSQETHKNLEEHSHRMWVWLGHLALRMPSQVLQGVSWGTARARVPGSLKGQRQNSQVTSCRSQSCQGCVTASRVRILGKPAPLYRLEICACPSSPSFQQCFVPNYIAQFCTASDFLSYQNVSVTNSMICVYSSG